jgi:uncharacterized protein YecE (DUF72 family)
LREQQIALVVADTAGRWPYLEDVTSDFVYVRLHGDVKLYESGYTDAALERWAERIRAWRDGCTLKGAQLVAPPSGRIQRRDVYVYFDNDIKVHAPYDAMKLAAQVEPGSREEKAPREERRRESAPQARTLSR